MGSNTHTKTKPIAIIGAGLAGLTTGRLLKNAGIPVVVFEASKENRTQGFSISLRPWGVSALLAAFGGLPPSSIIKGVAPDREIKGQGWIDQSLRNNRTAELLLSPPPGKASDILRANRNALRRWIIDQGEDELDVRYGHRLKSFSGQSGDLTIEFENGVHFNGSLIVAADGVHSSVRSLILPSLKPEVLPVVVYHGEFELSRDEFDRLIKPLAGNSLILAGVGDGFNTPITICDMTQDKVHLDWSYSRPATGEDDPLYRPNVAVEEARQLPDAFLKEIGSRELAAPWSVIVNPEAMKNHRIFYWTSRCLLTTRDDMLVGVEKGVVFVGDAWHAMPLFGGEGGSHALLDGVELAAQLIASSASLKDGVDNYYLGAFDRCSQAVRRSRQRFFLLHRSIDEWREIARMKTAV